MDLATKAEERPLPDLVRLYIFFKLRLSLSKLYFFPRVSCVSFLRRAICQTPCSIRHRGAEPSSMHCFRVHVSIANQPTGPVLLLTVPCSPPPPVPSPLPHHIFIISTIHIPLCLQPESLDSVPSTPRSAGSASRAGSADVPPTPVGGDLESWRVEVPVETSHQFFVSPSSLITTTTTPSTSPLIATTITTTTPSTSPSRSQRTKRPPPSCSVFFF